MAAVPQGAAFLSTMARLEQPRDTPGNVVPITSWITFDAVLPCQNNSAISPILCNARYLRQSVGEIVEQGIYHIFLKVSICPL